MASFSITARGNAIGDNASLAYSDADEDVPELPSKLCSSCVKSKRDMKEPWGGLLVMCFGEVREEVVKTKREKALR